MNAISPQKLVHFISTNQQSTVLILHLGLFFVRNWVLLWCTLMKTRNAAHGWVDPHTIDSLFFVFPSDMWCKINKLLKYYDYQLTKCCLEERLEGFKVYSWFLKILKLVEYRIAKKRHDFNDHCWGWLRHHHSRVCHVRFYLIKQSLTVTKWFYKCYKLFLLKEKSLNLIRALVTKLKMSSYGQVTIITVKS